MQAVGGIERRRERVRSKRRGGDREKKGGEGGKQKR